MGVKPIATYQLPYGATSIGVVSSSNRSDAVPAYDVFSRPGAEGMDVAHARFRCGMLFRSVGDEVARARQDCRFSAPSVSASGETLTDGASDASEQVAGVLKAMRLYRLEQHFDRVERRFIASVLERGRFNQNDIEQFNSDERVWQNQYTPQFLVFTSMSDLLRDAEKFPLIFTTDDIVEAYASGYRAEDANACSDLYSQYDDSLSAFEKLFLVRNEVSPERANEFFEAGLTHVCRMRDAVRYRLTAQDIRDYDAAFSPYQIYRFKRLRIPNGMAIQLTQKQMMLAMGGKTVLPGLLARDLYIGGRGHYDGSPKGVVPMRTRVKNRFILAIKRYRAYRRLMKDGLG